MRFPAKNESVSALRYSTGYVANRPGSAIDDWLHAEDEIRKAEDQAVDVSSPTIRLGHAQLIHRTLRVMPAMDAV